MSLTVAKGSSIEQLISDGRVETFFQPITSIKKRSIIGFEALARGVTSDGEFIPPGVLFEQAQEQNLLTDLDLLCRDKALHNFHHLHAVNPDLMLFLNLHACTCSSRPMGSRDMLEMVRELNLRPANIAIELLESEFRDVQALQELMTPYRQAGFLLVLDDVGAGHSNLDRIPLIQPDILKIDRSLVHEISKDYYRQEVFKSLVNLSKKIGALIVAEGIETQPDAMMALELGADMLQGYYFARPMQVQHDLMLASSEQIESVATRFKGHMVEKINGRKLRHRRYNIIINSILCELAKVRVEQFEEKLVEVVSQYPNIECMYVLDEAGTQVTPTIVNPVNCRNNSRQIFRPAPKGADHSLKEYYYVLLDVELNKYTTEPYVSLATGNLCHTISTMFRDANNNKMFILCIDVIADRQVP